MSDSKSKIRSGDWSARMHTTIGLGVAGNFTGHLEQAGEADDFREIDSTNANAPKGIFPFFVPGNGDHFLHRMPISSTTLTLGLPGENHQIEPEVALLCDVTYEGDQVVALSPRYATAHNDCSIRRPGARKISEKKNWGAHTKGTSSQMLALDRFERGGVLDQYRIACFLLRGQELFEYGVDSAVTGYSYYGDRLIDWLIERMNGQRDQGPLEDIAKWIQVAGKPAQALISIGATRYTDYGETTFLEVGDVASVILYDAKRYSLDDVRAWADGSCEPTAEGISVLRQHVHRRP